MNSYGNSTIPLGAWEVRDPTVLWVLVNVSQEEINAILAEYYNKPEEKVPVEKKKSFWSRFWRK